MLTIQCRLSPRASVWQTLVCGGLPISRAVLIQISSPLHGMETTLQKLLDGLLAVLKEVQVVDTTSGELQVRPKPMVDLDQWRQVAGHGDGQQLAVVLGDGKRSDDDPPSVHIEPAVQWHLDPRRKGAGVLPVLPQMKDATKTLPPELQALNVCFWSPEPDPKAAMEELALTVLARAGVTSFDRRVFISYRRTDTQPMALQLFQTLTERNYSVFLDTVSIHPGVDFQQQLFEHLADKSMVVMLESKTFFDSPWTQQELSYTLRNDLSLLVLRLPEVEGTAITTVRDGAVMPLKSCDLEPTDGEQARQFTAEGLKRVLRFIHRIHDRQMLARTAQMGARIAAALRDRGINHEPSPDDASVLLPAGPAGPINLVPAGRPPRLEDLHDAWIRHQKASHPVLIGRTADMAARRQGPIDWAIDGKTVDYCDIEMLDVLLDRLGEGRL